MKYLLILFLFLSQYTAAFIQRRDYFSISVNKNNDLLIEGELHDISELSNLLYYYYTDNYTSDNNVSSALYMSRNKESCKFEKAKFQDLIVKDTLESNFLIYNSYIKKLDSRLFVMNYLNVESINFISDNTYILIKMRAASSYNTYIQILTEIKKTIHKLRDERARELFNLSYKAIQTNQDMVAMKKRLYVLQLLVPDRIVHAPIIK